MANLWPNFSQYNTALHHPEQGLIPEFLKKAQVARNGFGIPDPLSGGVAYIYKLTLPEGQCLALRLFMQQNAIRDSRLPCVFNRLADVRKRNSLLNKGLLDSQWIERCVKTTVGEVPAVVMDWSSGLTLNEWLRHHKGETEAILALREQFFQLLKQMEAEGIAHGDLQVGNILVEAEGRPVLVDYDGIAFLDETGQSPNQGGHPNFQHPKRFGKSLPNNYLDRFPAISIDIGLEAWAYCSKEPWFGSLLMDGDTLFFSRSDYEDPEDSEVFRLLKSLPQLNKQALLFEEICKGSVLEVPSLEDFRKATVQFDPKRVQILQPTTNKEEEAPTAQEEKVRPIRTTTKKKKKASSPYVPNFPLFSAWDVDALLGRVGEMVEIIGKITEIFEGETKYGDPYIFVNFMDWREKKIFHLVAWSEDLDSLEDSPDISWEGKWIQVTGLVDEPYYRKLWQEGGREQVRLSIRIRNNGQYRFLSETEALRRLRASKSKEYPTRYANPSSDQTGKSIISSAGTTSRKLSPSALQISALSSNYPKSPIPLAPTVTPPSSNQEILKQLGTVESRIAGLPSPSSSLSSTPPSFPSSSSQPTTPKQYTESKSNRGCLFWFVIGVIYFLYLLSK